MSSLSIREFQEADRGDVIALWTDCGLVVPWNDPGKDIDRRLKVDPELFLVGSDDTGVVATVMGGYEALGYCTDDVVGLGKRLVT
jgi:hypothetical protein